MACWMVALLLSLAATQATAAEAATTGGCTKLPLPASGVASCKEDATGQQLDTTASPRCSRYACSGVYSRCIVNAPRRAAEKDSKNRPLDKGFCTIGSLPGGTTCSVTVKRGSAFFVAKVYADGTRGILRKATDGKCQRCNCKKGVFADCVTSYGCVL